MVPLGIWIFTLVPIHVASVETFYFMCEDAAAQSSQESWSLRVHPLGSMNVRECVFLELALGCCTLCSKEGSDYIEARALPSSCLCEGLTVWSGAEWGWAASWRWKAAQFVLTGLPQLRETWASHADRVFMLDTVKTQTTSSCCWNSAHDITSSEWPGVSLWLCRGVRWSH